MHAQGNKCAVLTLQLLGFEVDPINSVQFSNHAGEQDEGAFSHGTPCSFDCVAGCGAFPAGYPSFKGSVFDGQHLQSILTGLEDNGITSYTHLLTGYVGSVSLLKMIAEVCRKLREWNPDLMYGACVEMEETPIRAAAGEKGPPA